MATAAVAKRSDSGGFEIDERTLENSCSPLWTLFLSGVWKGLNFEVKNTLCDKDLMAILKAYCPFAKFREQDSPVPPRKIVGQTHQVVFAPEGLTLKILKKIGEGHGKTVDIPEDILEKYGDIRLPKNKYLVVPLESMYPVDFEAKKHPNYEVIDLVSGLAFYLIHEINGKKTHVTFGGMVCTMKDTLGEKKDFVVQDYKGTIQIYKYDTSCIVKMGLDRIRA